MRAGDASIVTERSTVYVSSAMAWIVVRQDSVVAVHGWRAALPESATAADLPLPAQLFRGGRQTPGICDPAVVMPRSSRMTRAGFPTARTFAGRPLVTTAPAPTTVFSPIVTPGQTMTPPPSQTLSPIEIGLPASSLLRLGSASTG